MLANGTSEAEVKIDDKNAEAVTLVEIDGVKTVVIASTSNEEAE